MAESGARMSSTHVGRRRAEAPMRYRWPGCIGLGIDWISCASAGYAG
jgi:hypothetical protein